VLASGLVEVGGHLAVLGGRTGANGTVVPAAALVDPRTSSVTATASIPALAYPARIAVAAGGRIVVGDWAGQEPEPKELVVLDPSTLAVLDTIPIEGVPCALGAWGGRLLVVERTGGRLLSIDPLRGVVEAVTELGTGELLVSDVVVLDAATRRP
jgi:hypothetical protein